MAGRVVSSLWFRGVVTALLLGLVLTQVDFSAAARSIEHAQWGWLAAALGLMAFGIAIGGVRWYLLLQAAVIRLPRREAIRAFSLAILLNSVLPTAVGGDAVRAWIAGRPTRQYVAAATSVVLDKVSALVCLFAVAWVALLVEPSPVPKRCHRRFRVDNRSLSRCARSRIAVAAGSTRLAHRLPDRARAAAGQAWSALRSWARVPKLLALVLTLGVAYQLIAVLVLVFVAKAIGVDLAFSLAAVSAVVVIVATLFPISIGGFGVREGSFVLLLHEAGISATDATLLSLLSVVVLALRARAARTATVTTSMLRASAAEIRESRG